MDVKVAEKLSLLLMRINADLDDSVAYVRDHCGAEELQWYRREVGQIMGALYLDLELRLWAEHPGLKPRAMDGPYEVDPSNFANRFYAVRRDDDV